MTEKRKSGVLSVGGNHYATVQGYVYSLKAFGREDQARVFAVCISGTPDFKPENGWISYAGFFASEIAKCVS